MKQIIIDLFGEYQTRIDEKGRLIGGVGGLDYEWLFGCFIFAIILICVFKILGGIIKKC